MTFSTQENKQTQFTTAKRQISFAVDEGAYIKLEGSLVTMTLAAYTNIAGYVEATLPERIALGDLHNIDGNVIGSENEALLYQMLATAKGLFSGTTHQEADEYDSEYLRGMIEIMSHSCGVDSVLAKQQLPLYIFDQ